MYRAITHNLFKNDLYISDDDRTYRRFVRCKSVLLTARNYPRSFSGKPPIGSESYTHSYPFGIWSNLCFALNDSSESSFSTGSHRANFSWAVLIAVPYTTQNYQKRLTTALERINKLKMMVFVADDLIIPSREKCLAYIEKVRMSDLGRIRFNVTDFILCPSALKLDKYLLRTLLMKKGMLNQITFDIEPKQSWSRRCSREAALHSLCSA